MSDAPALPPIPDQPHRCARGARDFGQVAPVLHEIRHALSRLVETGEPTRIDLSAMPYGPGDL